MWICSGAASSGELSIKEDFPYFFRYVVITFRQPIPCESFTCMNSLHLLLTCPIGRCL
jgi:hypothetical protein